MTDPRTLRVQLAPYNRGVEWEWTCGELHICLELIFGEGSTIWDNLDSPILAINPETGGSLVFRQTWRGLHSLHYSAEDLDRGILNIPLIIWKNKTLFKHVDAVMVPHPAFQP